MNFLNELIDMVTGAAGGVGNYLLVCLVVAIALFILVIVSREFLCWFLKIPSLIDRLSHLERKLAETTSELHALKSVLAKGNTAVPPNVKSEEKEDWNF